MPIKLITQAILLTVLAALTVGCASTQVYVLDQAELVRVKSNQTVTSKFDGWLLSDRAVNRVMDAKIKKTNLE